MTEQSGVGEVAVSPSSGSCSTSSASAGFMTCCVKMSVQMSVYMVSCNDVFYLKISRIINLNISMIK